MRLSHVRWHLYIVFRNLITGIVAVTIAAAVSGCRVAQSPPAVFIPVTALAANPKQAMPSIMLGAAVDYNYLVNDAKYRETLKSNFSLLVPKTT